MGFGKDNVFVGTGALHPGKRDALACLKSIDGLGPTGSFGERTLEPFRHDDRNDTRKCHFRATTLVLL